MDLDDFWQENKRWILGCVAGLLVFLIAYNIVGDGPNSAASVKSLKDVYKQAELTAVKKEKAELDQTLAALKAANHYELPEKFVREGRQPGLFWAETYIKVRKELIHLSDTENVEFPEASFAWDTPSDPADIDRALVGCSLVDFTVRRLVEAHKATVDKNYEAIGLRSIGAFTPDRSRRSSRLRRRADDPIEAEDLLSEVRVGFKFEADHVTVHRFLENCRTADRKVTFGSFKIVPGRPGDPLKVSGEIIALTIKPIPKDI